MNVQHRDFTAERAHPKDDVLTATFAVTASLCMGHGDFCEFEAEVLIYRDEADEIVVCDAFYKTFSGKKVRVEGAPGKYNITPDHFIFDAILYECRRPNVLRDMAERMMDIELGVHQ